MNESITNDPNYTPVGFKTKAVLKAIAEKQNNVVTTNEKIQALDKLNTLGSVICSPIFQQYEMKDKASLLREFAELNNIVNSYK